MGKRGPSKTPTAILQMRGSRVLYDRPDNEPEPEIGIPDRPGDMSELACQVWDQLVLELNAMGVLSIVDWRALQRYCELFVDWKQAQDFIRRNGTTYTITEPDEKGKPKLVRIAKFPQVNIRDSLTLQLLRLEQEFGLTPSARAGLGGGKVKHNEKSIEKFLA
jgi:P27 family predicted phage terminase small subunit